MNNEMDIILSHYFSGEATKKELRILDYWLAKSAENEKSFQQMHLLYQHVGQLAPLQAIDTEKAWLMVKNYMYKRQKNVFFVKKSAIFRAAAAVLLAVGSFALVYFTQNSKTVQLTAIDSFNEYKLSENVQVTLFSGSEIKYNKKRNNTVKLSGKAAFHIASNGNTSAKNTKNLVVQAGETYIEDIGTIFTVDAAHSDKFIAVKVTEGIVHFYTKTDTGICLKSNDSAVYDVQTKQFTQFFSSELIFQNTPLQDAIKAISIRYNVDILISSESLKDIPVNASFDKNEPLENVLDIIAETVSARWEKKKGGGYVVGGRD